MPGKQGVGLPRAPLLTLLVTLFVALLGVGFVAPFLPILATQFGASGFALGLLMAGFSLSMGLLQPFAGFLSDRHGRKRFLASGLAIYTICGFGYSLTGSVMELTILRFIQGIGAAGVFPIAMAYMGDWSPPNQEGRYMGILNIAVISGIGAGPLLGGVLNDSLGMQSTFYAMGSTSAFALLLTLLFLPSNSTRSAKVKSEQLGVVFRSIIGNRVLRGVLLARVSMMLAMVPSFVFLPVLMDDVMHATGVQIGLVLTVRTLTSACLQFPFGWLADHYSRVIMTTVSLLGVGIAVMGVGLCTELWQFVLLFFMMGIIEAVFLPASSAMATESGREFGMGSTMGVFNAAMNLGMFLGVLYAGFMIDSLGFAAAFIGAGISVLVTGILAGLMMREHKILLKQGPGIS